MNSIVALPEGTVLVGDYRVERVLGAGGFGITYLATEVPLARKVTLKEYFPVDFAARDQAEDVVPRSRGSEPDYTWGLERFLEEAQTLARFTHPNIVQVYRYFRARKTGYIAMQFEEGQSFKGWLKGLGRAPRQPELDRILTPLLEALEAIHQADFLHRDIAPDNIIIRKDGTPVLIDFGSARGDIASHTKTMSALVKPGYSPYEQYASKASKQGPWTDIYSLGATLYHAITGKRPSDAPSRMVTDDLIPVREAALSSYRPQFLAAIDRALILDMKKRPQSVAEWRKALLAPPAKPTTRKAAPEPERAEPQPPRAAGTAESAPPLGASEPRAAASAGKPAQGVFSAFREGWRKAGSTGDPPLPRPKPPVAPATPAAKREETPPAPSAPAAAAVEVGQAAAAPVRVPPAIKASFLRRSSNPKPVDRIASRPGPNDADANSAPPASKREASRAVRVRGGWRWKTAMATKLAIGAGVAAFAVYLQEHLPQSPSDITTGSVTSDAAALTAPMQLKGHRGAINALAFTADGRSLVTSGADATLRVWDASTRALIRTLDIDHGPANAMAIEGLRAVTAHGDGTISVWDLATGARLAALRRSEAAIQSVAFLGDPERIAVAAQDRTVALWDLRQPAAPLTVLQGQDNPVLSVAFASSGGLIASGGADRAVRLWRADGSTPVRHYRGHGDSISALAFAPNGRKFASASIDGQIRIWSTLSSRLHYTLRGHQGRVAALSFSPDGEVLASASDDGTVRLWSIKQGRALRTFQSAAGELNAVGFAPDGRRLAAAGADGMVRLYNASVSRPGI